jgi:hypothetical protein
MGRAAVPDVLARGRLGLVVHVRAGKVQRQKRPHVVQSIGRAGRQLSEVALVREEVVEHSRFRQTTERHRIPRHEPLAKQGGHRAPDLVMRYNSQITAWIQ